MRFSSPVVGLALAASPITAQEATTIKVNVGANGALTYDPANFEATVGTKIEFHYFPKNHTVTQSSFKDPCHPLEGGFFSGFVPTTDSPSKTTFTIEVKDTKPIWFYCGQANHCQKGMIGAVNAPKTGNTFEAFAELAKVASNSTSPPGGPVGGVLSNGTFPSNSNSTATSAATTKTYTSTWTSNGQTFTTTAATTIAAGGSPAQTTWAYTTKPYTSTWTSNGQTFTTTATTTLFTTAPVAAASSAARPSTTTGAAAAVTGRLNAWNAGALVAGVAGVAAIL